MACLGLALSAGLPVLAATPVPDRAQAEFDARHIAFHPKASFQATKVQPLLLVLGARELRIYDFADDRKPALRFAVEVQASAAAFTHDGERIAAAGTDGTVRFWTLAGAQDGAPLRASDKPLAALAVSARGQFIVTLDETLRVSLWRTKGLALALTRSMARQKVEIPCTRGGVAISPDEKFVAAISCTNDVYLWNIAGVPIPVAAGRSGYEACCGVGIGFTADSRYLVVKRSFQPGYGTFLAALTPGGAGKLAAFPGVAELRHFAPAAEPAGDPRQLLIADIVGLRLVGIDGTPKGPSLMRAEGAHLVRAVAATADGSAFAALNGESLILLPATRAPIALPLR